MNSVFFFFCVFDNMISFRGGCLRYLYHYRNSMNQIFSKTLSHNYFANPITFTNHTPPSLYSPSKHTILPCHFHHIIHKLNPKQSMTQTRIDTSLYKYPSLLFCCSYSNVAPSRSFRRRASKRLKANTKPRLDEAQFHHAISQLPPRFGPEELSRILSLQKNPVVCLEIFNWASQQPRFRHDVSTYHVTIKNLGAAKLYQEMDGVVNQVLAVPYIGSEALYNSMIYYFVEAQKLIRAVNILNHMRSRRTLDCRPSVRTYNILFAAFLRRGNNSYISHLYMEPVRRLFKQMIDDGVEPDVFSLNSMIKGYVHSLHVNDALRIFHQMGVVFNNCLPNSYTYDYLIHGLCAQGRTNNARELYDEMKRKGFIPSSKVYNSLVNALALGGQVEEAVNFLREMFEKHRSADFITYQTVLDEMCRQGRTEDSMQLLKELQEKELVDGHTYRKLLNVLEDDFGNSSYRNRFR